MTVLTLMDSSFVLIIAVMAYVFGVIWGRKVFGDRPLTPLSPNKTWEGFIGGGISTVTDLSSLPH